MLMISMLKMVHMLSALFFRTILQTMLDWTSPIGSLQLILHYSQQATAIPMMLFHLLMIRLVTSTDK